MVYLNKIRKILLGNDEFSSITSDGRYIYLTMPQRQEVFVLNRKYKLIDKIKTKHPINNLTFVPKEMIFLGIETDNNEEIIVYDMDLVRAGKIPISNKLYSKEKIVSIEYNNMIDKIIIGYESHVSTLDYFNNFDAKIIGKDEKKINTGIYSKNNIILSTFYNKNNQYLEIIESGKKIYSSIVNHNYKIKDILIEYKENVYYLYILTATNKNNLYLRVLSIVRNENNFRKKTNIYQKKSTHYKEKFHSQKEKFHSQDELIKSIARIENRLSYIIEAEEKKIKQFLFKSANINDILKMNESINETIVNITHLEIVLYETVKKLQRLNF